ncbi:MAG TPA: hypothetical protein VMW38_15020, partial [Terriglobia bacterium]|nr:hypothetical protein [Terriglobia bacterium]
MSFRAILDNRTTWVILAAEFLASLLVWPAGVGGLMADSPSSRPPRKVIVGTVVQAFWGEYPGLPKRLEQLETIV